MKRRPIPALAALALSLFLTAGVLAQSSSTYGLTWNNIGAGGGQPASASYVFESTIGQPDAGTMSGSQFTLTGGFIVDHGSAMTNVYLPTILSR